MTEVEPREFYASPVEVQRPPEQDPPLTTRVRTRQKRDQPGVRRALLVDAVLARPWVVVSGPGAASRMYLSHDDVRTWYIDNGTINISCAYRWHLDYPPERQTPEEAAQRGDLDVSAFRTHAG